MNIFYPEYLILIVIVAVAILRFLWNSPQERARRSSFSKRGPQVPPQLHGSKR